MILYIKWVAWCAYDGRVLPDQPEVVVLLRRQAVLKEEQPVCMVV